jgi:hypothetical protein
MRCDFLNNSWLSTIGNCGDSVEGWASRQSCSRSSISASGMSSTEWRPSKVPRSRSAGRKLMSTRHANLAGFLQGSRLRTVPRTFPPAAAAMSKQHHPIVSLRDRPIAPQRERSNRHLSSNDALCLIKDQIVARIVIPLALSATR